MRKLAVVSKFAFSCTIKETINLFQHLVLYYYHVSKKCVHCGRVLQGFTGCGLGQFLVLRI